MKNKIFKANPQLDFYFETTDGECFFTENAAKDHARSLTEKAITTHNKSDYSGTDSADETDESAVLTIVSEEVIEPVVPAEPTTPVEQIKFIDEVIEPVVPTEPITPVVSLEPKAIKEEVKNSKK